MDEQKLLCYYKAQVDKLCAKIEDQNAKLREMSIRYNRYMQDYEGRYAQSISEHDHLKRSVNYLATRTNELEEEKRKTLKFLEDTMKIIKSKMAEYEVLISTDHGVFMSQQMDIPVQKANRYLSMLHSVVLGKALSEEEKKQKEIIAKQIKAMDEKAKGLEMCISPEYDSKRLLKELHKLIDGHGCKEHVPYILILREQKVFHKTPTWEEMRNEFKNIGAQSNSNYHKFLKYKLKESATEQSFKESEINTKRSQIKTITDICHKYHYF